MQAGQIGVINGSDFITDCPDGAIITGVPHPAHSKSKELPGVDIGASALAHTSSFESSVIFLRCKRQSPLLVEREQLHGS